MKRLIYAAALCVSLVVAGTSLAQPRGGPGRPGFVPPKQQGSPESRNLEQKLDRLDAQLKELEAKVARTQGPSNRTPERPKASSAGRPGPGGFGPGMSGFGPPRGGFGGMAPGGERRAASASNADFERRLDRIIGELEQLKKDMKGGSRDRQPRRQ